MPVLVSLCVRASVFFILYVYDLSFHLNVLAVCVHTCVHGFRNLSKAAPEMRQPRSARPCVQSQLKPSGFISSLPHRVTAAPRVTSAVTPPPVVAANWLTFGQDFFLFASFSQSSLFPRDIMASERAGCGMCGIRSFT